MDDLIWTEETEDKLIDLWQENECLYAINHQFRLVANSVHTANADATQLGIVIKLVQFRHFQSPTVLSGRALCSHHRRR